MADMKEVKVFKPDQGKMEQARTWPIWSCEVSTFDWHYTQRETCLILEGQVTVTDPEGNDAVDFSAGDMVIFPDGLSCVWQVKAAVKKHYKFD